MLSASNISVSYNPAKSKFGGHSPQIFPLILCTSIAIAKVCSQRGRVFRKAKSFSVEDTTSTADYHKETKRNQVLCEYSAVYGIYHTCIFGPSYNPAKPKCGGHSPQIFPLILCTSIAIAKVCSQKGRFNLENIDKICCAHSSKQPKFKRK